MKYPFIPQADHTMCSKRNKKRAECIVEFYKREGIFKKKCGEARAKGECFSHFSSVLKNSQVLV